MLILWVITPLQSAIFTPATFYTLINQPEVSVTTGLAPLPEQAASLNMDFMNRAYEILWLSAPLPAYVNSKYVVAPCHVLEDTPSLTSKSALEVDTVSYWSELECRPYFANFTNITSLDDPRPLFNKECGAAQLLDAIEFEVEDTTSAINYIPFWQPGKSNWSQYSERPFLSLNSSCSVSAMHDALVLWAGTAYNSAISIRTNVTAQFCSAKYYSQRVKATLTYPEYQPISTKPLGPRNSLSEAEFNATNFEYLIGLGQSTVALTGDWPNVTVIPQDLKIEQLNVSPPFGNMVGFALGNRTFEIEDYSVPQKQHEAFEAAHQLLFALAVTQLKGNHTTKTEGKLYGNARGIIMVPGFSIAVELALVITAVATLGLLITNWDRHNKLRSDPASLQDFMRLLSEPGNLGPSHMSTVRTSLEVQHLSQAQRYRLDFTNEMDDLQIQIVKLGLISSENASTTVDVSTPGQQQGLKEFLPWELTRVTGFILGSLLLLAIIALTVLLQRAHSLGGLPRPSDNIVVRQILLNYIPTIFATILEPTWVLINRLLCMIQPLESLKACNVPAFQSIALKYTSLPPQLVVTRAIRAKHYLLASVCSIALLANLLAVALSSVFQDTEVPRSQRFEFRQPYQALLTSISLPWNIQATRYRLSQPLDHYYVLKSNFTDAAPLPPWTTRDLYFLPFTTDSTITGDSVHYQAITRAFGISPTCQTIASSTVDSSELKLTVNTDGSLNFTAASADASDPITCIASSLTNRVGYCYLPTLQQSSLESIHYFEACLDSTFIADWLRYNVTRGDGTLDVPVHTSFDYLILSCEAKARTARFLTTVNEAQQVVAAEQISAFEYDMDPYINKGTNLNAILNDLNQYVSSAGQNEQLAWHTDAYAQEYFNAILKLMLNGTNVDPSSPLPTASKLGPLVEDLYTGIFAILLGLSPTSFAENVPPGTITGKILFNEPGITMNPVMTVLAIAILWLNLTVVIVLYLKRPGKWLLNMPTTIADVWAIVGSSWEVGKRLDYREGHVWRDAKEEKALWGYGKFLGRDGKCKIGIERWPFVIPLTADDFDDKPQPKKSENKSSRWLRFRAPKRDRSQSSNTTMTSILRPSTHVISRTAPIQGLAQMQPSYRWSSASTKRGYSESCVSKNTKDSEEDWPCFSPDSAVDIGTLSGHTLPYAD